MHSLGAAGQHSQVQRLLVGQVVQVVERLQVKYLL